MRKRTYIILYIDVRGCTRIYIHIYIDMHMHMHIHTHKYTHTQPQPHRHAHTQTHTHSRHHSIYRCIDQSINQSILLSIYLSIHVSIYLISTLKPNFGFNFPTKILQILVNLLWFSQLNEGIGSRRPGSAAGGLVLGGATSETKGFSEMSRIVNKTKRWG